jgi:hypothetical protein
MITVSADTMRVAASVRRLGSILAGIGGAECLVIPTRVITYLCEQRGTRLLAEHTEQLARSVRAKWVPKVEAVVRRAVDGAGRAGARAEDHDTALARAYRYGAYLLVEGVWREVLQRGIWGSVAPGTVVSKRRDVAAAAPVRRRVRPRRPGPAAPTQRRRRRSGPRRATVAERNVIHYGVRRRRPVAWYRVAKGEQSVGSRPDRPQETPVIEVRRAGRVISSK